NIRRTAKSLGIPQTSLRQWRNQADTQEHLIRAMQTEEISLSEAFERAIKVSLARLAEILPSSGINANLDAMKTLTEKFFVLKDRESEVSASNSRSLPASDEVAKLLLLAA